MSHHSPPGAHGWQVRSDVVPPQSAPDVIEHRARRSRRRREVRQCVRRASAIAVTGSLALFVLTVLASCAPGLMSRPLVDGIPAGLLLALVQPLAVVLAVVLYEIAACRPQDPPAGTVAEQPAPEPWWAVVR